MASPPFGVNATDQGFGLVDAEWIDRWSVLLGESETLQPGGRARLARERDQT